MDKKPTKNLVALKVSGPILSIPVSWAIKVVPQIKVQKSALNKDIDLDIYLDCQLISKIFAEIFF